jgi:hypothetical protein
MVILYGGRIHAEGATSELLADSDRTVISTSALDEDAIQEVESALRRRGLAIDSVERPRQRLEDLFMGIVNQAQSEAEETSGALQGGATASFLSADESAGEGESLIASLEEERGQSDAGMVERRKGEPGKTVESAADTGVLENLLEQEETKDPVEKPRTELPHKPDDHDSSVIDGLLGEEDGDPRP